MVADEKARHWTSLHALPLSRSRSAGIEITVSTIGSMILLATAATALWAGAAVTGAPLRLGVMRM